MWVQTNDESLVGTQRTVIRGCDQMSNLLEVNFYINVSSNAAPEFETDIQTQWNLNVGDNITYPLPKFSNPDGNDAAIVYINSMENQDFPPFVNFTNATNSITFLPNNRLYQGRTYYFSVVLKQVHSDFMVNIFYMTVKILGDPVDPSELRSPNKTTVAVNFQSLNYSSMGQITFSMAVLPYIFAPENSTLFWDVFDMYVIDVNQNREEIIGVEFQVIDNMTVNFTVQFQNPYMYGLLNMQTDNLYLRAKDLDDESVVGLLVLNATNQTLAVIDD